MNHHAGGKTDPLLSLQSPLCNGPAIAKLTSQKEKIRCQNLIMFFWKLLKAYGFEPFVRNVCVCTLDVWSLNSIEEYEHQLSFLWGLQQ